MQSVTFEINSQVGSADEIGVCLSVVRAGWIRFDFLKLSSQHDILLILLVRLDGYQRELARQHHENWKCQQFWEHLVT